jgi:hypothetical protein
MNNYNSTESILARVPNYKKKDCSKANLPDFLSLEIISKVGNTKEKTENNKVKSINKNFIEKVVICLVMLCHSSCRGVQEFVKTVFDYEISLDRISKIINGASERAEKFNKSQNLNHIKEGALDEIFSGSIPVLVGVDLRSTYTFLLSEEGGRKGIDWGIALLEKQESQNLELELAVMDQGLGMCLGVKEIYGKAKLQGDLFHIIREVYQVIIRLENKAYKGIDKVNKIEDKYIQSLLDGDGRKYGRKYSCYQQEMKQAISLYEDMNILKEWFKESLDIFAWSYEERVWTYNYVLEQMKERINCDNKIKTLVKHLEKNMEKLLCFARILQERLVKFKEESCYDLTLDNLRDLYRQLTLDEYSCRYWILEGKLLSKFGEELKNIQAQVKEIINTTFRASSIVEDINSLIRPYFFLRKCIGRSNFLQLLQFFFNTRTYKRSKFKERVGKSPLELLTGEKHQHWLQLLGCQI